MAGDDDDEEERLWKSSPEKNHILGTRAGSERPMLRMVRPRATVTRAAAVAVAMGDEDEE